MLPALMKSIKGAFPGDDGKDSDVDSGFGATSDSDTSSSDFDLGVFDSDGLEGESVDTFGDDSLGSDSDDSDSEGDSDDDDSCDSTQSEDEARWMIDPMMGGEQREWVAFEDSANERLEAAFESGRARCSVRWRGQRFHADLSTMQATGRTDGLHHPIQRRITAQSVHASRERAKMHAYDSARAVFRAYPEHAVEALSTMACAVFRPVLEGTVCSHITPSVTGEIDCFSTAEFGWNTNDSPEGDATARRRAFDDSDDGSSDSSSENDHERAPPQPPPGPPPLDEFPMQAPVWPPSSFGTFGPEQPDGSKARSDPAAMAGGKRPAGPTPEAASAGCPGRQPETEDAEDESGTHHDDCDHGGFAWAGPRLALTPNLTLALTSILPSVRPHLPLARV